MSFTYSLSTNIGKVRLKIFDTDQTNAQLTDEELQIFIDEESTVIGASAAACESLSAKYSLKAQVQAFPGLSQEKKQAAAYLALAKQYRDMEKNQGNGEVSFGTAEHLDTEFQTRDYINRESNIF